MNWTELIAWTGNLILLISIWRLGGKHKDGWWLSAFGNLCWLSYGFISSLWAVAFIDGTMLMLALNNLRKW